MCIDCLAVNGITAICKFNAIDSVGAVCVKLYDVVRSVVASVAVGAHIEVAAGSNARTEMFPQIEMLFPVLFKSRISGFYCKTEATGLITCTELCYFCRFMFRYRQ
jgi:hypothetical protein